MENLKTAVALAIPTYNGASRLDYLLQSINRWTEHIPPMAVLDDGTPPIGARKIREVCEKWKVELLVHDENMGIAKSWNDLTRHFDSDIMVLLNDDLLVAEDWLKCLVYFVEHNKCGGVSLPFYFLEMEDVPHVLNGELIARDPDIPRVHDEKLGRPVKPLAPYKIDQIREDMSPGKIMCASGNIQAFKRGLFDKVGGFDDFHFKSFFEESDFYTSLAQLGYASYGLTYPHVFHCWGVTFSENPELEGHRTMQQSHMAYIEKWKVPREHWNSPFDFTNPKFMSKIPRQEITWMGKKGKIYTAWDS